MFLRRSKIVPNVAKGKKPKKKGTEVKKTSTEQDSVGPKEGLNAEANSSGQNDTKNSVSNEENETPVTNNIIRDSKAIAPPPSVPEPPIAPPTRSFLSSQDESASSADEANKKSKAVSLPKFRKYKPRITLGGKVIHKPTPTSSQSQEVVPPQNTPETTKSATTSEFKNSRTESTQLARPELSVSPSKHLVPAAPHCVPISTEASSSEDEGVIDPYDPNNPQGPKSDNDRIRHRKNQRIKKTFVGGKPTAMIDYLFYNPKTNPMVHTQREKLVSAVTSRADEELEDEPDQPEDTTAVPAPQLIFGPDGKMVIDEKSLVIERKETREGREALYKTPVVDTTGFYTSQRRRGIARKQWTNDETVFFYKCLNRIGPDFCLISKYFPGCTRHQIKLKFKLEERRNPLLVDKAFKFKTTFDTTEIDAEFEKVAEKACKDREEKKKKRQPKVGSAKRGRKPQKKKRRKGPKGRADYYLEDSSAEEGEESEMDESEPDLGSDIDSETQDGEERKPSKEMLRRIKQEPKQGEQRALRRTSVATSSQAEVIQSSVATVATQETSGTVAYLDIAEPSAVAERTLDPRELQVADVENIMNSDSQHNISNKTTVNTDNVNQPATSSAMSVLARFLATQKAKNSSVTSDSITPVSKTNQQGTSTQVNPQYTPAVSTPQSISSTSNITSMSPMHIMKIAANIDSSSDNPVSAKTRVNLNVTDATNQTSLNPSLPQSSSVPIKNSATATTSSSTSNLTKVTCASSIQTSTTVPSKTNHIVVPSNERDGSVINIINRVNNPETILGFEGPGLNFYPQTSPIKVTETELPISESQISIENTEQEESNSTVDPESPTKRPVTIHTVIPTSTPGRVINIIAKADKPETILGPGTPIFNSNILNLLHSPSIINLARTTGQQNKQNQSYKTGAEITERVVIHLENQSSKSPVTNKEQNIDKTFNKETPKTRTDNIEPSVSEKSVPNEVKSANSNQINALNVLESDNTSKSEQVTSIVQTSTVVIDSVKPTVSPASTSSTKELNVEVTILDSDNPTATNTTPGPCKSSTATLEDTCQVITKNTPSVGDTPQIQKTVISPTNSEHSCKSTSNIDSSTQSNTTKEVVNITPNLPEIQDNVTIIKTPSIVKVPQKVLSFRRPNFKPLINKKVPTKEKGSLADSKTVEKSGNTDLPSQDSTFSFIKFSVSNKPTKTKVNVNLPSVTNISDSLPSTTLPIPSKVSESIPITPKTSTPTTSNLVATSSSKSIFSNIPSTTTNSILAKIALDSTITKLPANTTSSTATSATQSLEDIIVLPNTSTSKTSKIEKVNRRKAPLIIKIPCEEPCFLTTDQLDAMESSDLPEKRVRKRKISIKELAPTTVSTAEVTSPPVQEPEIIEVAAESEEELPTDDDKSDLESEDSSDSDAKYLTKPPRPTRSGRVPKAAKLQEAPGNEHKTRKRKKTLTKKTSALALASSEPYRRPAKKHRPSVPDLPRPVSPVSTSEAESSFSEDPPEGPVPGSLIVCKSLDPVNNKETYTVFMVPPNTGGTTLEHNPDGSLQKLTVGSSAIAVLPTNNPLPTFVPNFVGPGLQMSGETLEMLSQSVVTVEAEPQVPANLEAEIQQLPQS